MLKLVECTIEISWQGNVDCYGMVVPCHCDTTIIGTGLISGDFVLSANHRHEVAGVLFSFIFDDKVVNDKAESDGGHSCMNKPGV